MEEIQAMFDRKTNYTSLSLYFIIFTHTHTHTHTHIFASYKHSYITFGTFETFNSNVLEYEDFGFAFQN